MTLAEHTTSSKTAQPRNQRKSVNKKLRSDIACGSTCETSFWKGVVVLVKSVAAFKTSKQPGTLAFWITTWRQLWEQPQAHWNRNRRTLQEHHAPGCDGCRTYQGNLQKKDTIRVASWNKQILPTKQRRRRVLRTPPHSDAERVSAASFWIGHPFGASGHLQRVGVRESVNFPK